MEVADVKNLFYAEVKLNYGECPICELGHEVSNLNQTTEPVDIYESAYADGVDLAERHGGGTVKVIKVTEVSFRTPFKKE